MAAANFACCLIESHWCNATQANLASRQLHCQARISPPVFAFDHCLSGCKSKCDFLNLCLFSPEMPLFLSLIFSSCSWCSLISQHSHKFVLNSRSCLQALLLTLRLHCFTIESSGQFVLVPYHIFTPRSLPVRSVHGVPSATERTNETLKCLPSVQLLYSNLF